MPWTSILTCKPDSYRHDTHHPATYPPPISLMIEHYSCPRDFCPCCVMNGKSRSWEPTPVPTPHEVVNLFWPLSKIKPTPSPCLSGEYFIAKPLSSSIPGSSYQNFPSYFKNSCSRSVASLHHVQAVARKDSCRLIITTVKP